MNIIRKPILLITVIICAVISTETVLLAVDKTYPAYTFNYPTTAKQTATNNFNMVSVSNGEINMVFETNGLYSVYLNRVGNIFAYPVMLGGDTHSLDGMFTTYGYDEAGGNCVQNTDFTMDYSLDGIVAHYDDLQWESGGPHTNTNWAVDLEYHPISNKRVILARYHYRNTDTVSHPLKFAAHAKVLLDSTHSASYDSNMGNGAIVSQKSGAVMIYGLGSSVASYDVSTSDQWTQWESNGVFLNRSSVSSVSTSYQYLAHDFGTVPAGQTVSIDVVISMGTTYTEASDEYQLVIADCQAALDGSVTYFNNQWDSTRYSVDTPEEDIDRMSDLSMVNALNAWDSINGESTFTGYIWFRSLNYLWDTAYSNTALTMGNPAGDQQIIKYFLDTSKVDLLNAWAYKLVDKTSEGVGYAYNHWAITNRVYQNVCVTGDTAFLNEVWAGKTIIQALYDHLAYIQNTRNYDFGLAENILEAVAGYEHQIPDLCGWTYWMAEKIKHMALLAGNQAIADATDIIKATAYAKTQEAWDSSSGWFKVLPAGNLCYSTQIFDLISTGAISQAQVDSILSRKNDFIFSYGTRSLASYDPDYNSTDPRGDWDGPGSFIAETGDILRDLAYARQKDDIYNLAMGISNWWHWRPLQCQGIEATTGEPIGICDIPQLAGMRYAEVAPLYMVGLRYNLSGIDVYDNFPSLWSNADNAASYKSVSYAARVSIPYRNSKYTFYVDKPNTGDYSYSHASIYDETDSFLKDWHAQRLPNIDSNLTFVLHFSTNVPVITELNELAVMVEADNETYEISSALQDISFNSTYNRVFKGAVNTVMVSSMSVSASAGSCVLERTGMEVTPSAESVSVVIDTWTISGGSCYFRWEEDSQEPAVTSMHHISGLTPNTTAYIFRNSSQYDSIYSGASGEIQFNYTGGYAVAQTFEIYMGSGIPEKILAEAQPAGITADGVSTSMINVTLVDDNDVIVLNATNQVEFIADKGSFLTANPVDASWGAATVILLSETLAGTATVTATSAGLVSGTAQVVLAAGPPVKLLNTANPGSIDADGTSTSLITAQASDANDNPITTLTGGGGSIGWTGLSSGAGAWLYRKPVTVNAAGASTDYQVNMTLVELDIPALVSAGKVQADYDDVRFSTSADPENNPGEELTFWLDPSVSNSYGFFVKMSVSSGNNNLYMYYGNTGAASASNGSGTFIDYDGSNSASGDFVTDMSAYSGFIVDTSVNASALVTEGPQFMVYQTGNGVEQYIIDYVASQGRWRHFYLDSLGTPAGVTNFGYTYSVPSTKKLRITAAGYNDITFDVDGSQIFNATDNPYTSGTITFTGTATGDAFTYEWVLVRKYMATEPTVMDGSEEENITEATVVTFSVSGPGTLLGAVFVEAIDGTATVILRSTLAGGTATVTSTADSLDAGNVNVVMNAVPHINCTAAPASIQADGVDTSLITAGVYDAGDMLVTTANNSITFSVSGEGTLLGTDVKSASGGIATIELRSTTTPGTATVTATSDNLVEDSVNVLTQSELLEGNWHILGTGQSLSVGSGGAPALSTVQPFGNLMFTDTDYNSFSPLVEPITDTPVAGAETMSSALANMLIDYAGQPSEYDILVSIHGVGGWAYSQLKKGTDPYNKGMTHVDNARTITLQGGTTYHVSAITCIHGETDFITNDVTADVYEGYLNEWQSDFETDCKAKTGQEGVIPFVTDQMSSWTFYGRSRPETSGGEPSTPIGQVQAARNNPNVYLVCPKYIFDYSDGVHLNNYSYRRCGEYYGKVLKKILVDRQQWEPLWPVYIARGDTAIIARFNVPVPPLQFDTVAVDFNANYGFEYVDDLLSAEITGTGDMSIIDGNTVKLKLSQAPIGANQKLNYAYTGIAGVAAGAHISGSAKGNLRDSDTTPAYYQDASVPAEMGNELENWCMSFSESITEDLAGPAIPYTDETGGLVTVRAQDPSGIQGMTFSGSATIDTPVYTPSMPASVNTQVECTVNIISAGSLEVEVTDLLGNTSSEVIVYGTPDRVICEAEPAAIIADGSATSLVTASVCDNANIRVTTATNSITFNVTGEGTLIAPVVKTASAGIATVLMRSTTSAGTATITAVSDGLTSGSADVVTNSGPAAKLLNSASPVSIIADNSSTSLVMARAADQNDNPVTVVEGDSIGWNGLAGSGTWLYRKPLTINSAGALADYQVSIAFTDVGMAKLLVDGKVQNDYDDIRFSASADPENNPSMEKSYWVDVSGENIIVKTSLSAGDNTLYMYYGNTQAASASDGENTFEFYDDFEDGTLDSSKWDNYGASETGGAVYATTDNAGWVGIIGKTSFNSGYILEHDIQYAGDMGGQGSGAHGFWQSWSGGPSGQCTTFSEGTAVWKMDIKQINATGTESINTGLHSSQHFLLTRVTWKNTGGSDYYSTGFNGSLSTRNPSVALKICFGAQDTSASYGPVEMWVFSVRVRKYTANEPTVSDGSEEENYAPVIVSFSLSGPGTLLGDTAPEEADGVATVLLKSTLTTGTVTVTSTADNLAQGVVNVETISSFTPEKILITATPATITADGVDTSLITAGVHQANDTLVPTATNTITFSITGEGTLTTALQQAAVNGIATVELKSTTSTGTATVTATSANLTQDSAAVTTTAGPATKLVNNAAPASILADNSTTSLITAQASDQYDNPVTTMNGTSGWSGLSNGSGAWLYRKPLTITSSSALSDYQVKLAFTAAGVAGLISGGKMQANCEDVRFTLSDETTEVSYWLDSTFSDAKYFWLNIPSVANGSTVLYMYYGNPAANAVSDGDVTFELFDDFEGTTLDTGKWQTWQVGTGTKNMSVSGGSLNLSAQGSEWTCSGIYTQATTNYSSLIVEVKNRWNLSLSEDCEKAVRITDVVPALQDSGNQYRFDYWRNATQDAYRFVKNVADIGSVQISATVINQNPTNYEWERYVLYSGNQLAYRSTDGINYSSLWTTNENTILSLPRNLYIGYSVSEGYNLATASAQLDWLRVRQYASSEPSAAVGTEEENVVNATITFSVTGPGTLLGETAPEAIDGVATVIMQSTGAEGTITVNSTADSLTQGSVNVEADGISNPASKILATTNNASILADGMATAIITARLCNDSNELVDTATDTVVFSVSGEGTLVNPTSKVASGGITTIELVSTTNTGTPVVTATATGLTLGQVQVITTPRQVKILCTTDNSSILADGAANALVTARVCDIGNALVDTAVNPVTFSVSGEGTLVNPTMMAASSGIATVELQSTTNTGTPTVTATASGLSQGEVGITTLPRQVKIITTADRTSIASNGTSTALVTASVCDTGDALVNTAVETITFSISGDGTLLATTQKNAIAGEATIIMQSINAQPGTASVTATATGLSRDNVDITTEPKVVDPPTGLTITAKTEHTITLGWTAGEGNVEYLVEKSENGVDYTELSANHQVLTITDTDLKAGTTYYYKVYGIDSEEDTSASIGIAGMTEAVTVITTAGGGKVGTVGDIEVDIAGDTFTEDAYIDIDTAVDAGIVDTSVVKLEDTVRDITAKTLFGTDINTFSKDVELKMYYTDDDLDGVLEASLRIYWLDTTNNRWVKVGGTVDTDNRCVTAMLSHFSMYCVMGESSEAELSIQNVASYPNPMNDETVFTFEINRSASVKLEVFTVAGKLVKRYDAVAKDAGYNEIPAGSTWDGTDDSNAPLAGGLYLYKITAVPDEEGAKTVTATGKLVIMK